MARRLSPIMKPSVRMGATFAAIVLSTIATALGTLLLIANATNGLHSVSIVTVDTTNLPKQLSNSLKEKLKDHNVNPDDVSLLLPKGTRQSIYYSDGHGGIAQSVDAAETFFSYTPPADPPFNGTYLKWRSFAFAFKGGPAADLTTDGGAAHADVMALGNGLEQAFVQWEVSDAGIVDSGTQGEMLVAGTVLQGVAVLLLLGAFVRPARRGDTVTRSPIAARVMYAALAGCAGGGGLLAGGSTANISHMISGLTPGYVLLSEQNLNAFIPYTSSTLFFILAWADAIVGIATGVVSGFLISADYKVRTSYAALSDNTEMERSAFER